MNNRQDLVFLRYAESQDIKVLSNYVIKNKHGKTLTWENIVDELLLMGGNALVNHFRGHGVSYKTLLIDLCKKMKVKVNKSDSIIKMEDALLKYILEMSLEKLHQKLLEQMLNELGIPHQNFTKKDMVVALKIAIQSGGLAAYRTAEYVSNAVCEKLAGRGLAFAPIAAHAHFMFLLGGPLGWAIYAAWTAIDILGPAYRVTLPAVVKIACMRAKLNYESGPTAMIKANKY